jgi:hypothetical protein
LETIRGTQQTIQQPDKTPHKPITTSHRRELLNTENG